MPFTKMWSTEEAADWSWVKKVIVMGTYEMFRCSCVITSLREPSGMRTESFAGHLPEGAINIEIVSETTRGFVIYGDF